MEHYSGYQIYKNIIIWITEYRKWKILDGLIDDERSYIKFLQPHQYYMIKASDPIDNKIIYIFILSPGSAYAHESKHFSLLQQLMQHSDKQTVEMYAITENPVKPNILKKMAEFRKDRIIVKNYTYDIFKQVLPKAKNVIIPKHSIIDKKDVPQIMDDMKVTDLSQFPRIPVSDPQCIWIGAKIGDLLLIEGPSESAGRRIVYRYVI